MATKIGRPQKNPDQRKMNINITVDLPDLLLIDEIAKEARMNRSELMRNILKVGLDDARVMKKVGIFKAVGVARDIVNRKRSQMELPI